MHIYITPIFLQHVLPVTHAAAYTLCIFIKNNTRAEQRDELCCRFIEGMYEMLFLQFLFLAAATQISSDLLLLMNRFLKIFFHSFVLCCCFLDCGKGKSYRHRLLFIKICTYILEIFSRKFFKEHVFVFALELAMVSLITFVHGDFLYK